MWRNANFVGYVKHVDMRRLKKLLRESQYFGNILPFLHLENHESLEYLKKTNRLTISKYTVVILVQCCLHFVTRHIHIAWVVVLVYDVCNGHFSSVPFFDLFLITVMLVKRLHVGTKT